MKGKVVIKMKRFTLVLTDEQYEEFYRYFPDHGARTNLLRKCVFRLVARAKVVGRVWDAEAGEVADQVFGRGGQGAGK